ncbi:MAG: acylphosphatase [Thermodesulfobacteriota bacterium]|nr:acylphosphatase [Thermodesulfobacteriota bacterium]
MDNNKRIHALVHGRVQGVFFRDYTRREALRLGVTGWVRNLADGSVETEFEGNLDQMKAMLDWLSTGSPQSRVSLVDHHEITATSENHGFDIIYF